MKNLYIDIETVPGCDWKADDLAALIQPPANYKKGESIQAWLDANEAHERRKLTHALGLHPLYCQIVCVGVALDEGEPRVVSNTNPVQLLQDLGQALLDLSDESKMRSHEQFRFVGHNIMAFDLPVLWAQSAVRNVAVPYLPNPHTIKPWDTDKVLDTLTALKPAREQMKGYSLADMCRLLGVPDLNPDMDGSMVWDMFQAGQMDQLAEYCGRDVVMVRNLASRIGPWTIAPWATQP